MAVREVLVTAAATGLLLACTSGGQPSRSSGDEGGSAAARSATSQPRTWTVPARDPGRELLELRNTGVETAEFSLRLNGRGFTTTEDIIAEIRALPDEFPGEPLYRKAWRFVRDNRYHFPPLIWKSYLEDPMVFFASTGFGWCGTSSAVLTQFWRHFGYNTREWALTGHVVSEVFADGRWQLFDGDMEVYYVDDDGRVVGVEELAASPDLVTSPRLRVVAADSEYADTSYAPHVADIYATTANNQVTEYPAAGFELPTTELRFVIPPGGTLRLPGRIGPQLRTTPRSKQYTVPRFSNAQLTIPAGWRGPLTIPLVIQRIEGAGTLRLGGETWQIGSRGLRERIDDRSRFDHRYYLLELSEPLVITYLINPLVYKLQPENTVELTGTGLASLAVEVVGFSPPAEQPGQPPAQR